jgi:hypothetical protein
VNIKGTCKTASGIHSVALFLICEVTAYWKRPGYAPASRRRVAFLTPCSGLWPCVTTGFAEDQLLSCMTKRSLCVPTSAYVASYVNALREGYQMGSDPPLNSEAIEAIATDFPAHLVEITRQDRRITFSNGSSGLISPFSLFWFVEGEKEFHCIYGTNSPTTMRACSRATSAMVSGPLDGMRASEPRCSSPPRPKRGRLVSAVSCALAARPIFLHDISSKTAAARLRRPCMAQTIPA